MRHRESHARLGLAAVLAVAALFWLLDLAALRAGVPDPYDDVWEYGLTARALLQGHGFHTPMIHPPLWGLRDAALRVPVLVHGPLTPLLLAPLLALRGPAGLEQTAWLAALAAWLAAGILFRLGTRLAGPAVGAAAALAFTFAPLTVDAVNHDVSYALGALFLVLTFDRLARERPSPAGAAVALGLGALVRPEMPLTLAGFALLAGGGGTALLALGVALFSAAWWWHNAVATGSLFFNLSNYMVVGYTDRWPGLTSLRDFALTPARWPHVLLESAPRIPAKALAALPHVLKQAAFAPGPLVGWLAVVGAVVGIARPKTRWPALAALVCALVPLAVMSLTTYAPRYLMPFLPLWTLAVALGAEHLGGRFRVTKSAPAWIALLLLLLLPSTAARLWSETRDARALEPWLARERAQLAPLTTTGARLPRLTGLGLTLPADTLRETEPRLMFSDTPDFVAWTTGRPTVWVTRGEYEKLPASAPPAAKRARAGAQEPPAAGTAALADTLPVRTGPENTWFHDRRP
ncbi:MAG TPA: hypothetical protein VMS88_07215 [Terriglobales bacterium]|nr:hypothetical protein [Terriglobales bacterium]